MIEPEEAEPWKQITAAVDAKFGVHVNTVVHVAEPDAQIGLLVTAAPAWPEAG